MSNYFLVDKIKLVVVLLAIKMRKFFLGFSVLLIFFAVLTPQTVTLAKEDLEIDSMSRDQEEATESAKEEYSLPYPGILPDNPLYFLKAARDRIVLFLISDPLKRAEFNLLTSDKRVYASSLLADKNKDDLAVSTFSKSNNYMDQAIVAVSAAKKAGKNIDIVLHNLELSIGKHEEVLLMIQKGVDKKLLNQLQLEENRLNEFEKSVEILSSN